MTKLTNLTKRDAPLNDLGYLTANGAKALGVVGEVILVDENGNIVVSLGGGGAAGGGSNSYSDLGGDFTTTANTGTKTFDVIGAPFVVEAGNVAMGSAIKISSTGGVFDIELTAVTITGTTGGYVVTVADEDANFATTDTIHANIIGPERAYDIPLDGTKTLPQITPQGHYIDPVDLISAAQDLTGPFTDVGGEIDARSYNCGNLFVNVDINGATDVAFKLLVKHESGGSEEYPIDPNMWSLRDSTTTSTGGYKTLDSDVDDLYVIPFEVDNDTPYLQLQVGAPVTAGTAGNLGQLDTVVYTLGYK